MARRVVITGLGCVTPLGWGIDRFWSRILAGESGIRPTTLFSATTFPTTFAAEVPDFDLASIDKALSDRHEGASRNAQFALAAAREAIAASNLSRTVPIDRTRIGVYLGGGEGPLDFDPCAAAALIGCMDEQGNVTELNSVRWASAAMKLLNEVNEREQDPNMPAGHIAVEWDAQGPNLNTLTACAASTQAIGEAMELIRYGDADVMISGGAHSMIHPLGVTGFNRLTALSTRNGDYRTASRPFDRTRDGFVLGEGAGVIILEELGHARDRGANILGEVVAYGSTADAFRVTDMHEEARGPVASVRMALDRGGLTPDAIDYVSAHGTGTDENDKIETLAIKKVFGNRAAATPMSSIKSMTGHLIAAAGAVELITCVLAIRDGVLPPTVNYEHPDSNCDLDYVPNTPRKAPVRTALSNSFGFGGQNDTIIVRRFES